MTKEELKEAIAATITENGQKGITGQALANLLNEIVDAAGEGGGGAGGNGGNGGLTLTMSIDPNTGAFGSDPNEANAQVYQTIMEGAANGVAYPVNIYLDLNIVAQGAFFTFNVDGVMPAEDFSCLEMTSYSLTLLANLLGIGLLEDGSIIPFGE